MRRFGKDTMVAQAEMLEMDSNVILEEKPLGSGDGLDAGSEG